LQVGATGADVRALQQRLIEKGFSPGSVDGTFGPGTQAAVKAFQRSEGLLADGIAGPRTRGMLFKGRAGTLEDGTGTFGSIEVSRMFPYTPIGNIKRNLPFVLAAMTKAGLHDRHMVLMALATIRAETESFEPVAEGISRYNTSPNGHPFDLYDHRRDLGNEGPPHGAHYRGRGYVQLTGRHNYRTYGRRIGRSLLREPDLACEPETAATLLALFLGDRERAIKEALLDEDYVGARRLVNGGSHGLDRFTDAYRIGIELAA